MYTKTLSRCTLPVGGRIMSPQRSINYGGGAVDGEAEVMEEALMAEVTVAVEMVSEMDVRCLGWKWWALCRG